MIIKVKVGTIDTDGYCGRDLHPEPADRGKIGRLLSMTPTPTDDDEELTCYLVQLPEGRTIELVDHEIEAICGPFWEEPERLPPVLEVEAGIGFWKPKEDA